jgi:glycosyltransferase involved in cell wall biosynthesis
MARETHKSICIVVENLPVPVDRRVWREACALRDAGYRVSVICPRGTGSFEASFQNIAGIEIYRHRRWEASGVVGYLLEYSLALLSEFYLTLKVFARTRFRILQACNPPDTIFLIGLLLKPFGVRFIFDHHDLAPELFESKFGGGGGLFYRLSLLLEFFSFKTAKVCIATNESFKEIAVARGGKSPEDVFIVRNCPDLSSLGFRPLSAKIKFPQPFLVVYVGFMGSQDGLVLLLESIEYLVKNQNRQDTHFVLVGGGSELPMLRAQVAKRGLESFVTFTGQVPYDEVATYLSSADIGVSPDPKTPMNDNSTMIKILEYMAYGLPVVLFDLKEGRRSAASAALYATPNDPVDFAKHLARLLNDEQLRRELGSCGRQRVREGLNWESEKRVLLEAYRKAWGQTDTSSTLPADGLRIENKV